MYKRMIAGNMFDKVKNLRGWIINREGKIVREHTGIDWKSPWVFSNNEGKRDCSVSHQILFGCFKIIPKHCLDCYKVVLRPRNVIELFELHNALETNGIHGKCGVEIRPYVPAIYGGYSYNRGLEAGKERLSQLKGLGFNCYLKRACTEFELHFGPSDKWEYKPEWADIEQWVESVFDVEKESFPQPEYLKVHIMCDWVKFAAANGDMTYKQLTGGEPLYEEAVRYL